MEEAVTTREAPVDASALTKMTNSKTEIDDGSVGNRYLYPRWSFSWNELTKGRLYHREAQVEKLKNVYEKVSAGIVDSEEFVKTQLVLISVDSGT